MRIGHVVRTQHGVGDAPDSFAFDGKRVYRWNGSHARYGEDWVPGDVIGCLLDLGVHVVSRSRGGRSDRSCRSLTSTPPAPPPVSRRCGPARSDDATITFMRNGRSMGVAFRNIRTKMQGLGYFAGISMSQGERSIINLGERPFQYPPPSGEGYRPLVQSRPPLDELAYLLECVERLAPALTQPTTHLATEHGSLSAPDVATLCLSAVIAQLGPLIERHLDVYAALTYGVVLSALIR